MAKHRLEQPNRGSTVAKKAVIAGSITLGSLAAAAGPALAAPVHTPLGTFEIPALPGAKAPEAKPAPEATPVKKSPAATVEIPNLGQFTVPGIAPEQIPQQFRPQGGGAPIIANTSPQP